MTARWNNLPVRCRCSHAAISHTRGVGNCWVHPCACETFRASDTPDDRCGYRPCGHERAEHTAGRCTAYDCECRSYSDPLAASMARHPAGKAS